MKKLFLFIILIGMISGGFYFYSTNKSNDEVISLSEDLYLIVEDQIIEFGYPVILDNDLLYFSYNFIKEYIDEDLFYDEVENTIIFTNENYVKRFIIDEKKGSLNSKEYLIDNSIIKVDNKIYIPLDLFIRDYDIKITHSENTNAVILDFTNMEYLNGEVILENGNIRTDLDIKSPIIKSDLKVGSTVLVYGEYEKWLKVRTFDGIPGFIEKKFIKLNHIKDIYKNELITKNEPKLSRPYNINLTWDYTYAKVKNTDNVKQIPGVNVISPTWFSIDSEAGNIKDKGNRDYVLKYIDLGYELWPLVDNNFNPDMTHELLKSSITREKLISDLLAIYMDYGFQGINLDFENVYYKDKDLLTQFVRELYPVFKENNLIVSMDVTTLSTSENWSLCFDRKRLHKSLDYVMLMAYDQHWASSPIAGSVAEYSWVEDGLVGVLQEIPSEKLILAVPFYTRLWTIDESKISSKSISMSIANKFVADNQIQTVWNEDIGQYYGEVTKGDKEYRLWIEDEKSLMYKVSLVHKYKLAGIASWRKGFETPNIWNSIDKSLN